jgi:hypothetical protein
VPPPRSTPADILQIQASTATSAKGYFLQSYVTLALSDSCPGAAASEPPPPPPPPVQPDAATEPPSAPEAALEVEQAAAATDTPPGAPPVAVASPDAPPASPATPPPGLPLPARKSSPVEPPQDDAVFEVTTSPEAAPLLKLASGNSAGSDGNSPADSLTSPSPSPAAQESAKSPASVAGAAPPTAKTTTTATAAITSPPASGATTTTSTSATSTGTGTSSLVQQGTSFSRGTGLLAGDASLVGSAGDNTGRTARLVVAHGALMITAFLFLFPSGELSFSLHASRLASYCAALVKGSCNACEALALSAAAMPVDPAGVMIARHGKQSAGGKAAADAGPTVLGMPCWKVAHLGCQYVGVALVATAIGIAWCHMYNNTAASVAGSLLFHAHKYIGMAVVVMIGGQVSRRALGLPT